jgi:UPF0176 protein
LAWLPSIGTIGRDGVAVTDTRNDYEVATMFDGVVDPQTASFGQFPAWWEEKQSCQ